MELIWNLFSDTTILSLIALWLFYWYSTSTYDYWRSRGVPFLKPIPFFGSSLPALIGRQPFFKLQYNSYNSFPNAPYVGQYEFRKPVLYIRDPALVQKCLIEDFTHFYNRGINTDSKLDPLSQHLVNLEDIKWKSLRNKLTPVFSSGKLKTMHHQLITISDSLAEMISKYVSIKDGFEARELMARFTTDVIGHCAFGIKMNALTNENSEFRSVGRRVFKPSIYGFLRQVLRSRAPLLLKMLRWKAIPKDIESFFINVVQEAVVSRETNQIEVKDFLQLLIELKKVDDEKLRNGNLSAEEKEVIIDEVILAANAFVFFLAGFETTASTLSYCIFELARNPEIQAKLRKEVQAILINHEGQPTFDAVKDMPYLDCCISETLRMYPPAAMVSRVCTKEYRIPDSTIVLPIGARINIPIYSLQHDPKYYPEPETFDPNRFQDPHNIKKGTYLPFGDGPRICIGMRFAKLEMKVLLATLLNKYEFSVNPKTKLPLTYEPRSIFMIPIGGLWIDIKPL